MAEISVPDTGFINYANLGAGAGAIIIGPVGSGATWIYQANQVAIMLQNRSAGNIEVSFDVADVNGILIAVGVGLVFHFNAESQDILYCAASAVGNCIATIMTLSAG